MIKEHVWNYMKEFIVALTEQLKEDEKRWGDTWKKRITLGQETRIYNDITDYYDQWAGAGTPIPWLKVAGLAMIAWIRDSNPNEFSGDDND